MQLRQKQQQSDSAANGTLPSNRYVLSPATLNCRPYRLPVPHTDHEIDPARPWSNLLPELCKNISHGQQHRWRPRGAACYFTWQPSRW